MQIHDLNTKALTNPAYVAFDDGTDTYKADFKAEIDNAAADAVADTDLTENTVAFTSGDAASPTAWTAVNVLTSGLTIKVLFNRISTMIKNVRWLYSKLGTTDISSIGGGTVTGAISSLNSNKMDAMGDNTIVTLPYTCPYDCYAVFELKPSDTTLVYWYPTIGSNAFHLVSQNGVNAEKYAVIKKGTVIGSGSQSSSGVSHARVRIGKL